MERVLTSLLSPTTSVALREAIAATLSLYPAHLLELCAEKNVRVCALTYGQSYREASPAIARLGIDVDSWPAPPEGLFMVEERTIYARSASVMTIAHEFGHALDCALGDGVYFSCKSPAILEAFLNATRFVTPYAVTGCDEYFAEGARAMLNSANDVDSHWPRATSARLRRVDPTLHQILSAIFAPHERSAGCAA